MPVNILLTSTATDEVSQLLTDAGAIFTKFLGWIPDGLDLLLSEPILFIPICIGLIGSAFGILSRIFHRN